MTGWQACASADWTDVRGVIASFFTTLLTIVFLFSLTGYQITSEQAATRLLGRLGASLIEIDRWLPSHLEELQLRAEDRPNGSVPLAGVPVAAEIPSSKVRGATPGQLHDRVIEAMGQALYKDGTDALRDDNGPVDLSVEEPVRWATQALEEDMHSIWLPPMAFSGIVLAGLCLDFMRMGRSPLSSILVGAFMATFFAAAAWVLATLGGSVMESGVDKEVMQVARDGAFMGLRNSVTMGAAATALMLVLMVTVQTPRRDAYYELDREEAAYVGRD
jgi:hypothetical protein